MYYLYIAVKQTAPKLCGLKQWTLSHSFSVGQEALLVASGSGSHTSSIKGSGQAAVISRFDFTVRVHSHGCWQNSSPHWLVSRDISSLPQGLHKAFTTWQLVSFRASEWGPPKNWNNSLFASRSHHFCHILFIRNKILGPLHPQSEGIATRRWNLWGSLGASKRSRASYFILGQLVEDNNHIFRPLKPLYSNISTFISSLVGSFHSFNRNADRIAFRWLLSRNALLERSLYYSPLLATPSYIKTVSNFLSCLFFFLVKLFFRPFTNLEMIIFLFGKCEITHLRWFFKNTGKNVFFHFENFLSK